MSRAWMPMYWGDYMADTQHLTTVEHGAYLLLIGAYWSTGRPLVDDDKRLAAIAKQMLPDWLSIRETISEFFDIEDGKWIHTRLEQELSKSKEISRLRSEAGSKGGSKRQANASSLFEQKPSIPQSQSQSHKDKKILDEMAFAALWGVRPKRSGNDPRNSALTAYRARLGEGVAHEQMLAGVQRYRKFCDATDKTGSQYVMRLSTFLGTDRCYEQEWRIPPAAPRKPTSSEPRNYQDGADSFRRGPEMGV